MKILRIVKKDSKNVSIHLDNEKTIFINYEVFVKRGFRKNDEISDAQIESLIYENQKFAVKQRAFRYLARRLLSEYELRIKLKQKKYNEEVIEETINNLRENNYLNDMEFANVFSDENIKNKYWGKNKVKAELIKRGINGEIISQILLDKFPDGNNLHSAIELAEKKYNSLIFRKPEKKKMKEKLFSYLFSKGYDYETSKEAVESLIKEDEESFI